MELRNVTRFIRFVGGAKSFEGKENSPARISESLGMWNCLKYSDTLRDRSPFGYEIYSKMNEGYLEVG